MRDTLSEQLNLLVDDFADEHGDWSAVLRDARHSKVEAPRRRVSSSRPRPLSGRRWTVRVAIAAGIAAAAALAGLAVIPGGGACNGPVACASAAITTQGEVVHMVAFAPGPSSTAENVYDTRYEVWSDSKTGEKHTVLSGPDGTSQSWTTANGDEYLLNDRGLRRIGNANETGPDLFQPLFTSFGSYDEQLRGGRAKLAGTTTFEGRKAYMIDFHSSDEVGPTGKVSRTAVRILVDADSYKPVGAGVALFGSRWIPFLPRNLKTADGEVVPDDSFKVEVWIKIASAEFTDRIAGMFDPPAA